MNRREFIGAASVFAGPAMAKRSVFPSAFRLEKVGLQLYTVRALMESDLRGTLELVRDVGYEEVEFAGYFGATPGHVRRHLMDVGLTAPSTHVQFTMLRDDLERTLDTAAEAGHRYLVLSSLPTTQRTSLDSYRSVADLLNRAGVAARARGMRVGYHNHAFEFPPIEGAIPYDILIQETEPALVAMQMDLYWIRNAGQDALTYLERYPGRFESFHVKDMDPTGAFADVGQGVMDFPAILGSRAAADVRHYFVEHDRPADPLGSVRNSFGYLSRLRT